MRKHKANSSRKKRAPAAQKQGSGRLVKVSRRAPSLSKAEFEEGGDFGSSEDFSVGEPELE
jgi:hypothetical protein